jgi:hypothetical protein
MKGFGYPKDNVIEDKVEECFKKMQEYRETGSKDH